MDKIIFKGVINSLSFGNLSYNLLRELYRKETQVAFFPFNDKLDFQAYDKIDEDFKKWIVSCAENRFHLMNKDYHTLSQWHLNGSESRISKKQTLFSFYESDQPTSVEKSIVDMQDNVIFGSSHASLCFAAIGCENTHNVPVGFDEDFTVIEEDSLPEKIHFGLMGKFENRKNTAQILKNWAKLYGNNYDYQLSCCITNPFFKSDQLNQLIGSALEGKSYGNINFLPRLQTNSEVNEFLNAIDIDLSGLSGAEGWNIPSFNATALGKWSIVMNHTSHKDWADEQNSILIDPDFQTEIYDQAFFHKGTAFNQGNMNKISDETMISAFKKSEKKYGKINKKGLQLKSSFTYEKTLNKIMEIIQNEK